jgi:hypothetical protein
MQPFVKANTPTDVERYTPPDIIAAVQEALGRIDLDPCTTELVNRTFIRAKHTYTRDTNGLDRERSPWAGRVFINPPSWIEGKDGPQRNGVQLFWERLITEYQAKRVTTAIFLAFNLDHLQQSQHWNHLLFEYPFCIPERRIVFYQEKEGRIVPRESPEFSSAIIWVGKGGIGVKHFVEAFKNIGAIVIPKVIVK